MYRSANRPVGNSRFRLSPPATGRYQPSCGLAVAREKEEEGERGRRCGRTSTCHDPVLPSLNDPYPVEASATSPPFLLVTSNKEKTTFFSSFEAMRRRGGD
ncbi:hypothetical protein B296_00038333, partial [Ensete ventricosum]